MARGAFPRRRGDGSDEEVQRNDLVAACIVDEQGPQARLRCWSYVRREDQLLRERIDDFDITDEALWPYPYLSRIGDKRQINRSICTERQRGCRCSGGDGGRTSARRWADLAS